MDSKEAPQDQKLLEKCPNCGFSQLAQKVNYCPSCGQAHKEKRVTVWSLFKDAFADFFNLDNKLWQTTLYLCIPGKLTKDFFVGRRQRYISPLRFFIITSLAFFAIIQLVTSDLFESDSESESTVFLTHLQVESDSLRADSAFLIHDRSFLLDSLYTRMHERYNDTLIFLNFDDLIEQDSTDSISISQQQLENLDKDDIIDSATNSLLKKYGKGSFWEEIIRTQVNKLQNSGADFWSYFLSKLVWMLLLMIPFLALFFKLLYIRRGFYFVDHMIFFFHTHAFTFIFFSIVLLLVNYFPESAALNKVIVFGNVGLIIYYFVAMLRVYGQSKTKTFIKLSLIGVFYCFLFVLAISITSIISALVY